MFESKAEKTELVKKDTPVEPLAMSRFSGGNVRIVPFHIEGPDGGEVGVSHEYIGIGPLLVPCTRGEQKALSGDVLVEVIKADPADPTKDLVYLFLLPREVAEVLKDGLVTDPPATLAVYQAFLDSRARRTLPLTKVVATEKTADAKAQTPTKTR